MATKRWREKNQDKLRAYRRKWYRKNRQHAIAKSMLRRKALQLWLREYKSTLACEECGENHPACLVFHHIDPSKKDIEIARIVMVKGWGKERILKEIAKCRVLCSNCHRKLEWDHLYPSGGSSRRQSGGLQNREMQVRILPVV